MEKITNKQFFGNFSCKKTRKFNDWHGNAIIFPFLDNSIDKKYNVKHKLTFVSFANLLTNEEVELWDFISNFLRMNCELEEEHLTPSSYSEHQV